jgi:hypothetical protein
VAQPEPAWRKVTWFAPGNFSTAFVILCLVEVWLPCEDAPSAHMKFGKITIIHPAFKRGVIGPQNGPLATPRI